MAFSTNQEKEVDEAAEVFSFNKIDEEGFENETNNKEPNYLVNEIADTLPAEPSKNEQNNLESFLDTTSKDNILNSANTELLITLSRRIAELETNIETDSLTGLSNRRYFETWIKKQITEKQAVLVSYYRPG